MFFVLNTAWCKISWLHLFHNYRNEYFLAHQIGFIDELINGNLFCLYFNYKEGVSWYFKISLEAFEQFNRLFGVSSQKQIVMLIVKYVYILLHCVASLGERYSFLYSYHYIQQIFQQLPCIISPALATPVNQFVKTKSQCKVSDSSSKFRFHEI